jgi:hypothetical protein
VSGCKVAEVGGFDWMTPGSPILVFLDGRQVLANIRCILPGFLRCEALWEGDVPVVDESAIPSLLRGLAIHPATERLRGGQSPTEVARFVRESFALSPGSTYRVLRGSGVPYLVSKEATDRTLSGGEARATDIARAAAIEVQDDPTGEK